MTMNRMFLRGIVVSFFLCLTASLAFGQDNRTWVSGTGTDPGTCAASNICTRTAPCATFACAIQATSAGGEIDALDSADYGGVSIGKSISIVAEGVVAGIQISGTAIDVAAGSSVVVVLRGLTLDGSGTGSAILLETGAVLHIEDCTINGFDTGILVEPDASSKVFIKDTIVRNNGNLGIDVHPTSATTVTASLDNVRLEGNGFGNNNLALKAEDGTNVSVRNSVVAGNAFGLQAVSTGRAAVINLESSIVSGNRNAGIQSEGANSTINITNVTVVDNSTGLSILAGGHIVSFGNNKITDNTTNGSPTKTISQK
jgi:hypothetical protein